MLAGRSMGCRAEGASPSLPCERAKFRFKSRPAVSEEAEKHQAFNLHSDIHTTRAQAHGSPLSSTVERPSQLPLTAHRQKEHHRRDSAPHQVSLDQPRQLRGPSRTLSAARIQKTAGRGGAGARAQMQPLPWSPAAAAPNALAGSLV